MAVKLRRPRCVPLKRDRRKSTRVWPRVISAYREAERPDDREGVRADLVHPLQAEGEHLSPQHLDACRYGEAHEPPAASDHEEPDNPVERSRQRIEG